MSAQFFHHRIVDKLLVIAAAKEIAERGSFNGFKDAMSSAEINKLMSTQK